MVTCVRFQARRKRAAINTGQGPQIVPWGASLAAETDGCADEESRLKTGWDESFDHRVRDEAELHYVDYNPVRAGLAANPRAWPWSSARLAGESACPTIGPIAPEM
jgi:hypothetical protein